MGATVSDVGTRTRQSVPRVKTAYPGIYYRDLKIGRRYEIAYTDSLGKRRFETVEGGLRDAQRARAAVHERMHRGERVAPSKLTVKQLAEDYLRTQCSHLKPSTLADYGYKVDHWIVPELGHLRVSACDKLAVQGFIAELARKGKAPWTIRGCLTPLSGMFQYAVDRGWAASNPVRLVDSKKMPRTVGEEMSILTTEQIREVVARAHGTYKLLIKTAIFTGLRLGELLRLKWEDVNLADGYLIVRESKTEAGTGRRVALAPFLVRSLAGEDETEGLVFRSLAGTPIGARNALRALHRALEQAGIPRIRFHDLRHTFASLLIAQGLDVTYVSKQLGHSSPQITLRIYAHIFEPERREEEAKSALEGAFSEVVS